ncbi:hypothetical protein [Vogesella urethralis]|jgi:disulfide bond formation protein DsbB|uniref:hypothetical protein n=1 Tax=Vogesella urethralis TaxID=2592656 RepID=UPI001184E002|nr:hypothetical protein [Vogesella urethralis]MEC5205198.1 disulfide bond formation protein DsbB [Vogesella perlucida]
MFYALLIVTLGVALLTSVLVARFFSDAVLKILKSIIGPELAEAWRKYMSFAIVVVGVSGGVNMWEIQKYLQNGREQVMELNGPRWTMEIYRTAMDTLSQISWVMLLFFLCAMVAYVIMRVAESSREQRRSSQRDDDAA